MSSPSSANQQGAAERARRYPPGELIEGKYRLVRPLGHGGMGTVWVAHNTVLDVNVALKLITLGDGKGADELAERLLREARASARLGHSAIVRVFDFGRTPLGDPFIVMELLHGESIATLLNREQRLPATQALQILLPIADALSVAHGKGVIHRDVKPENVILCTDGDGRSQPKLLDFGIATIEEPAQRITEEKRLTREGSVVGTPAYMSPEQAMGKEDIDHRSDVWSFSVMCYELVTGDLPFDADNYNALLYEIIHTEPRPVTQFLAGDDGLWQILKRGLGKKPEERWDSIRTMAESLCAWLLEQGVTEDVCGASLKSTWLSSPVSSGRVEVPTSRPPAEQPLPATPPESAPGVAFHAQAPASSEAERKGSRYWLLAFAAVCFGAGFAWVRVQDDTSAALPLSDTSGPSAAAQAAAQGAVASPDEAPVAATEELETEEVETAAAEEPLRAIDDEEGEAAVPVDDVLGEAEPVKKKHRRPLQRPPVRRQAPPRPKAPKKKKGIDFGF